MALAFVSHIGALVVRVFLSADSARNWGQMNTPEAPKLIKQIAFSLILVFGFIGTAFADLTPEQQAARDEGLMLYQQHMGVSAIEPLRVAAEAGDRTAQYFLGETLRLNNMFMTAESRKWYEAAAEQGDLFAMLRLSSSSDLCHEMGTCGPHSTNWRSTALALAHERAVQGDVEAMQALFNAGQGLEWLEKAAEGGYAPAQELLASFYAEGEGWFLLPGRRQAAIEKWYKASAEGGFPLGMMGYANFLGRQNRINEASSWIRRAAEGGYIKAVYTYASYVAHMPDEVCSGLLNPDTNVGGKIATISEVSHDQDTVRKTGSDEHICTYLHAAYMYLSSVSWSRL